ncbi:MAG: hypothetical protein SEPTF4163_004047 [Sporothrix epigloea]
MPASSPAVRTKATMAAALDPAALDAFLVHLNKCMQTPAGIDAVLAALCYGARLGSVILNTAGGRALFHEPVRQLAAVLLALPSRAGALVILTNQGVKTRGRAAAKAAAGASALVLARRLSALGALLAEARMMLRLWGLLSMYVWARQLLGQLLARRHAAAVRKAAATSESIEDEITLSAAPIPPTSTAETLVGWTQLFSCIAYQVTENMAYLASKGVLGASPAEQDKLYRWSSRSFSVFIVAELGRLAVQYTHQTTETPEKKAQAAELHKDLARYASLAPITAHWGSEKGFLSETAIAVLGFIPAAIQMHRIWKDV